MSVPARVLLALLCLLPAAARGAPEASLAQRCAPPALEALSLDEVRLLRNEVYARRGRVFKDPELRRRFEQEDWYRSDPAYSDARLTAADRACIARLKAREGRVGADEQAAAARHGLTDVPNLSQFGRLTPRLLERLGRDGFVVRPGQDEQLFYVYEKNDYLNAPSFITTDSVLQLFHLFYDGTLRSIESTMLAPRLERLIVGLMQTQQELAARTQVTVVRQAAERNVAYLMVGATLLGGKPRGPAGPLAATIEAELQLIRAHAGRSLSPLLGVQVDYSQFVPRGHYTRTEALRRYFLAVSWLSHTPFYVDRDDGLRQAVLLARALEGAAEKEWRGIYDITTFYVGAADDLSPLDVKAVMAALGGARADLAALADPARLAALKAALKQRYRPRIEQFVDGAGVPPNVRFLGQRYVPDSEMLQKLSRFPERRFPSGLDVMAVLGSAKAREILDGQLRPHVAWPAYPAVRARLIADFARVTEKEWQQNLYYGLLWTLKALVAEPAPKAAPPFMRSPAWAARCLGSALGSWAELRHDTILYAKQSAAECGGQEPPPPPKGYVEPQPLFYRRLQALVTLARDGLMRYGALGPQLKEKFNQLGELLTFLARVTDKQLAGREPSTEEYEQIKYYGATLERLSLAVMDAESSSWGELRSPTDKHMAVIADVHTASPEVLEVGVGPAYEILVLAPRPGGGRQLTRGAVFSYYEFQHPMSDRLTDEKWQDLLKRRRSPPQPAWTDEYIIRDPKMLRAKPVPYGSGC